jgi:hypothetical protein
MAYHIWELIIIKSLSIPNVMVQPFHDSRNNITSRRAFCAFRETVAGSTA